MDSPSANREASTLLLLKPSSKKLLSCPVFRKLKLEVAAIVDSINSSPDALMDLCDRDAMDDCNDIDTGSRKVL
jgi:hypothetical protein